jgi:hypothetical protein
MWCGGNELFNSWSGMTEQHHALRLLDSLCYRHDRFTPFIMTSPLNGMGHGHYINYDEKVGREVITDFVRSSNTAYTEFGSPGMASIEYLRSFMSEEDIADCNPTNEVWLEHHGFKSWITESWVRKPEADYYFGGWESIEDLCNKTRFIQAMCYRTLFEEMRKQWPHCSMALNWCLNEPWPSAANNNLNGIGRIGTRHTHHGRRGGSDLLTALADLLDNIHGSLETVVIYANQQCGIAGTQKAAGSSKLGYAEAIIHQLTNQTGSVFILNDCDDKFHIDNTSCFGI